MKGALPGGTWAALAVREAPGWCRETSMTDRKTPAQARGWVEFFARAMPDGYPTEWTLACSHGASTTERVKETYSADMALGLLNVLTEQIGEDVPDANARALILIRILLAQLHHDDYGCWCAHSPFAIVEDPGEGSGWTCL